MTNVDFASAVGRIADGRLLRIAERACRCGALDGRVFRDLPGMHYGRAVTWRAWAFRNPRAVKYDRLLLLSRLSADGEVVSQVVPLQHATGWTGAPLDVLPAIERQTGQWAKLWRISWTDGTFDVIVADSRVRAKFRAKVIANQYNHPPGGERDIQHVVDKIGAVTL